MNDQAEILRQRMHTARDSEGQSTSRVIAVSSGKGGVGKSNFCINFALGLRERGRRPIVIDADVGFANVEVLLGVRAERTIVDVSDGLDIFDALQSGPSGLPFLSAGNGLIDIHGLSSTQMNRLAAELMRLQDAFDVVLIDTGAGLGVNIERLLSAADDLILVTTPEPTAIADAYALLKRLVVHHGLPSTDIVVNRAPSFVDGRLAAEKLRSVAERFLGRSVGVLGYILEDEAVGNAVMKQQALLTSFPGSSSARCIRQIVQNYLRLELPKPKHGWVGFFERMVRSIRSSSEVDSGHSA